MMIYTMKLNKLNALEAYVIRQKGTEAKYSGIYNNFFEAGTYICRQCNSPLFRSEAKFKSHCGWPSFDDEIPGAITRTLEADHRNVEISCSTCGGHLGHVFEGEEYTRKNVRHCVNSISINFIPEGDGNSHN